MVVRPLLAVLLVSLSVAVGARLARAEDASLPVNFNRDIRPILAKNCMACHGPDPEDRQGGLRLDEFVGATAQLDSGEHGIVPHDPQRSEVIRRITSKDESLRMPPAETGIVLTREQIDLLQRWIEQGAEFTAHWSLVPPQRAAIPEVADPTWNKHPVDAFIYQQLRNGDIQPSPEADRPTLIRRVTLDLTGLPPTPEEVQAFVSDTSPDAYEKLVDRLLTSPAYGERWARMWLDLARYADSAGLGSDPLRTIWRYRDWVIDALNRNLPYDQFTRDQLAGDLVDNPTHEQLVATAFHRNTMTNTEGGTDDEEFRVAAVKDRVDTTLQVWMGLTMGCAQCHTHKYDPITHHDYYSFFAFFNQTADNDQPSESPTMQSPTQSMREQIRAIDAQIAELKTKLDMQTPDLTDEQAAWEASLRPTAEWTVLEPTYRSSESGATQSQQSDSTILVSGALPDQDVYTIKSRSSLRSIAGLRLEVVPDASLPGGGSGRAADGNFVLSRISIEAADSSSVDQPSLGRYVRIEMPGQQQFLSLAEVQVFARDVNLARDGKASQSSTAFEGPAELAIDGNTDGHFANARSTTHTASDQDPWWEVDLTSAQVVDQIVVWNRTDGDVGSRLKNYRVTLLDEARNIVFQQDIAESPSPSFSVSVSRWRDVPIASATADYSQPDFPVTAAIGPAQPNTGWAVGPHVTQPHTAHFALAQPIAFEGEALLRIKLEHRFRSPGYSLGRFRLSVTDDSSQLRRGGVPAEIVAIVDLSATARSAEQATQLATYYRSVAPSLQPVRNKIASLDANKPALPSVPVMQELPHDKQRTTHVLVKGNFLDPGDAVEPAVPAALHPWPEGAPKNRLGVARWLTDPRNPLTSRVAVNRFWSQLFGTGLVETEEDFGTQGELPSHPELLDWLAVEFIESGWDMKQLVRLIVISQTYRQSSQVTTEHLEKDPRNRLLSRAPSLRLEAEMVRDQALALSGLLSRKIGGPSVFPPQPPNLWQAAFNGERTWMTSTGEDRYRRGLYTFWRRTVPYPSMATFDAPSREICSIRRTRTNTPLQAFVTLNDPVYVEAAQSLARRIVREGGTTTRERAAYALELCMARPAQSAQIEQLCTLLESELEHFAVNVDDATKLATDPLGPAPGGANVAELAAWTVVSNVLLNTDSVLTKR